MNVHEELPVYLIYNPATGDEAEAYGIKAARVAALTLFHDAGGIRGEVEILLEGRRVEFAELGVHGPWIRGSDLSRSLR